MLNALNMKSSGLQRERERPLPYWFDYLIVIECSFRVGAKTSTRGPSKPDSHLVSRSFSPTLLPEVKPSTGGSLVSGKHHLSKTDEGVSLCRRPEPADLPHGLLAVALGQVLCLLHAIALKQNKKMGVLCPTEDAALALQCHKVSNKLAFVQFALHLLHCLNHGHAMFSGEAFPIDEVDGNFARSVKQCIFSKSNPTPLKDTLRLAATSKDVIEGILDLDMAVTQSDDFLHYASGGSLPLGSVPLAHRYGGHQFGYWAGQLGDGRAHSLGQYTNRKGEVWELQLKGSGKTPYSRSGDGRAVIRSSVREFLCSEAMHFLGVPTSRAASLVVSDEPVIRDQFYSGNVKTERGAVVLRLAKSWFRIGSLEILAQSGEIELLRMLLNFVIDEHFSSINSDDPDKYLVFYSTVVNETARLIAQWMSVGFAHGVCNTDNFSLLSITIDYGPFGFMESYNPNFVPNTSDDEGRYSIGAQADVGLFNLEKLLMALSPVLSKKQHKEAKICLKGYADIYQRRIHQLFKAKLGLLGEEEDDGYLIAFLLKASH
ncbi:hypothetical protein FQN60_013536 [Etheostoma spectabile]|uniref:Selenoprotein O n=1 Tax=Etheostoma spectabile TaxID=54343 RepID=A0A5J5CFZ6_9PERO|nr:hypothetical protein FQN60_013536 [Etheostoma spectabile]